MARKFKVGDKVKVVKNVCINGDHHDIKLGRKGKVEKIESAYPEYPYRVKFGGEYRTNFSAKELEKVEDK